MSITPRTSGRSARGRFKHGSNLSENLRSPRVTSQWKSTPNVEKAALVGDLISVLLAPYDDMGAFSGRVRVSVPRMAAGESAATNLALIIHELATNSVKYGALSVGTGTLDVTCKVQENDVALVWTERGGPTVAEPAEAGFGSKLITRMAARLGGSFSRDWSAGGVIVKLDMKKDRLAA